MEYRYYKGKKYILLESDESISKLQDETTETVKLTVETKAILTEEEYNKQKENRRSNHVTW